ncbi:MAG TPA: hypothetical protein PKE63_01190 [Lacibacter sp.]|nr:hypothetical protein [Lacibacter sp.]HMO90125.1 hypothetical protein [Lacibacter sp.]HMP85856.1 hypothetical protein [Lacibacter sp.]
MLQNTDLLIIFGPAILIASLLLLVAVSRTGKQGISPLAKAVDHFFFSTLFFGVLLILLWLSLPSTPALKTFGFPADVTAVQDEKKLLWHLQEYNKAIVRTTEVVQWLLFLFVWWFLTTLLVVVHAWKKQSGQLQQTKE